MMNIREIKKRIVPILKKEGIKKAGIFGSYARGEQSESSDIDILVEFNGNLFKLSGLELELERTLRKKVDLITYKGINHHLKGKIMNQEVRIL